LKIDGFKLGFPDDYSDEILAHAVLLRLEKNIPETLINHYRILKKENIIDIRMKLGEGEGLEMDSKLTDNKDFFVFFAGRNRKNMKMPD